MRTLLLMRGSAGCGKSTWIEQNGLKPYTLCADDIRLLCQSPVLQVDGTEGISQANEKIVWNVLFELLEQRMKRGEFTVIDATNSKTSEINRYKKLCESYRYRMFCVDFTDIPIEEVKHRNADRDPVKRVPDEVIDKMYSRFATQKIPSGVKVIKPDELDQVFFHKIDLSEYSTIYVIGDIHGCNTVLQNFLSENGGIRNDAFYIFCGDYIDRGIENVDVVNFLISIMNRKNVLMLEGNHERWLWMWANDEHTQSKEFELNTKNQLDHANVSKKDVRQLYRRFAQCAYFEYHDSDFLVTHGGLSNLPENLSFVATEQMIKGVGNYGDFEAIANSFVNNTPENCYQIYGHRNTKGLPVKINDRCYNLEGRVEFGGWLRTVKIFNRGYGNQIQTYEVMNQVFKPIEERNNDVTNSSMADTILALRSNKLIQEKSFGNISSFNFTKKAFFDKAWDEQTTKARGLYIDTKKGKVAARAYEKFFNINEKPETKLDSLQDRLKFPVTAYVKENGFLGIVSWDEYNDDLLIASKSMITGQFAEYLRDMLYARVTPENLDGMKKYIKEHDVTFVFECVDMEHDPHVIEYPESNVYLLDIVYNQMDFKKYDFADMCDVANQFGLIHKELAFEIANWQDFYDFYQTVTSSDYAYDDRDHIEGFVIEDSNGWMVKLKLAYYNFWKFMRSIAQETIRDGYTKRTSALTTPLANQFYAWCKPLHDVEDKSTIPRDICNLRRMFYEDMGRLQNG